MAQLEIIFLGNFFNLMLINFFSLFLTNMFLGQVFLWKKHKWHFFCNSLLFSLLISLVSLLDLSDRNQVGFLIYSIILAIQFISGYLLIRSFYPMINYAQNVMIQTISAAILAVFEYVLLSLFLGYIQSLPRLAILFASIPISFVQVGAATLFCYMARRSQVLMAVKGILDYPTFMLLFAGSFYFSDLIVYFRFFLNNDDRQVNSWLLSLTYLILLIIFGLWNLTIDQKKKWENTQLMLIQQQNYLRQMEEVQKEIKSVHHDYKNMLAGIYMHASEGNTKEIQKFLTDKFFQLDHRIEEKLKCQNQLLLIENPEIKGLLISKLAKAESQGITIQLEISDIFRNLPMDVSDLLRILGIFLDNAIEAVADLTQSMKKISIVVMQDDKYVVIRIKNPNELKILLHELMQPNFSTKGKNRGFGLANVRKILAKYPHILNDIDTQNDQFIQTLTIKKE
ncbi:sensor histidine kinase [Enterococcus sp. AZ072]|uniref:sensor histidine kinase n=1 Tax=unclassified Enterococcus TaxID=2608891 RepID=UPI003D264F9A